MKTISIVFWLVGSILPLVAQRYGGEWKRVSVETTASFRGLSVVNTNVIWASGTSGTIIRTTDGGQNWTVYVIESGEKLDFRGIRAFDGQNAVVMSSGKAEDGAAQIYRTTDGGEHWTQIFTTKTPGVFFDAIAFWDQKHGMVLSDPVEGHFVLFTTSDGGGTWKQIESRKLPPALDGEGAFAASNSCLVVQGDSNVWFGTGGAKVARVFRSKDRGESWQASETPMHPPNASSGIFSLAFRDANLGFAVGGDYAHPENSPIPNIIATKDGGATWQADGKPQLTGTFLSTIAFPLKHKEKAGDTVSEILAAGSTGIFAAHPVKSPSNRDTNWTRESEWNINVVAYGSGKAWAVGPKGEVVFKIISTE